MKLFQNKFFVICLSVALVVAIVPSTFAMMGYTSLSKNIVGTLTVPFRWTFTKIADGFEGWAMYFQSIDAVREENERLKAENKALKDRLDRAELVELENERLREYLEMKNKYPSFTFEEGMIISHSGGNYMTTFTLNRGTIHGIKKDMPVVTSYGIVGQVTEVGLNWCMVSTLIEDGVSVGVAVPRSGETGILNGDYSMRYEGVCKISYLDEDADVKVGDSVYSSGTGSVYPADLKIGTVTAVSLDEYSRTLVATVTPAVDLTDIKWVMIITGYEND
ncbi:MAG: rod shape-determining protein MreC [Clostridia bacterium]|nr:rod shape-determining protein MreC [Clostridia bacterium]